jgi:hypothetical protein
MRVINTEDLKKLKKSRTVSLQDADRLLAKAASQKAPPSPNDHNRAIEQLVLSVATAVKANSELSQRATGLLNDMFIRVSKTPSATSAPSPEVARHWKVTVSERDTDKLIKTVDLIRVE